VDAPTKNRYRTAASWLAKNLVKHELLERNFVREIDGYGENDPRLVYYELDDAKQLIAALEQPYAAIAALAVGFCAEWGAIVRGRVLDLAIESDPIVFHVRGTKRAWRDRFVPLVPELAWTLDYVRPAIEGKLPTAPIIDDVPEWRAIDVQRAAAAELKLVAIGEEDFGPHSIHDWRQTHAVAVLRAGYIEQIAADHLGHKDTSLVRRNYGRFKPTKHDYAKAAGTSVTPLKQPKQARTRTASAGHAAGSIATNPITSAESTRRARGDK
jgi:integrase